MSKILKSLQFVTQSASPSTPSAGTGALFGSGSSFYFENSSGTVFDLAASNGYIVTRSYTGSTTGVDVPYTWSKSPSLKFLEICCVGGGGGGGGGRSIAINNQQVTTGGGGGAIAYLWLEASQLSSSPYVITVGRGGTPGAARVSTGTALTSNTGSRGGNTSFGSLVVAEGGQGGQSTTFASGGLAINCVPSSGPWIISGVPSGPAGGTNATTNRSQDVFDPLGVSTLVSTVTRNSIIFYGQGGAAGGSGGGRDSVVGLFAGRTGSGIDSTVIAGGYPGPTPGSSGTVGGNGGNGVNNVLTSLLLLSGSNFGYGLGTGGSGGGSGTTQGGNGGNGGYYGAGGGGGGLLFGLGSASFPSSSGAGGSGSSGLCLLIEYY
jgi:hypothetical protein